jgi:hypothetical protein
MKNIFICLALLLVGSLIAFGSLASEPKLTLGQEQQLSTNTGILNPNVIIRLKPEDNIVVYLPNGSKFSGKITKTEFKNKDYFEVFGEMHSHQNTGFGFVLTRDGVFAGAVVLRNTNTVYAITYSPEANGYILVKRLFFDKTL